MFERTHNMMEPTIYLTGPKRERESECDYPTGNEAFPHDASYDAPRKALIKNGWKVILFTIPANKDNQRWALYENTEAICKRCTAIYIMSGWKNCKITKAELALATALGLDVYYEGQLPEAVTNQPTTVSRTNNRLRRKTSSRMRSDVETNVANLACAVHELADEILDALGERPKWNFYNQKIM